MTETWWKKNPDGSVDVDHEAYERDHPEIVALEKRVAALEMFVLSFSEALSDDDDGSGGPGEFADLNRRWHEAHIAARARRQRERRE